jgi:hypothetical protein
MKKNKNFYKKQGVQEYYTSTINHKNINFINYLNTFEILLLKKFLNRNINNALILGMGYGREIDFLKKIYLNIRIDVIDFSKKFIEFGNKNYKNVNFYNLDLNSKKIKKFNFKKYDLIISLNTIDYLKPEIGSDLIARISKAMKKKSLFIFRLQSKYFIFSFLVNYLMKKRSLLETFTYLYDLKEIKNVILKQKLKCDLIKQPIILDGLDFLYSYLWNLFSYFEPIVRFLLPKINCRACYFICEK